MKSHMNKRECFQRAKTLIEKGTIENLRYAALELRFCMEAITYEKLGSFSNGVPPSVLSKWQPPQAVKALLEYEPDADQSFILSGGIEEEYGKPSQNMQFIGEHKALSLKWLRKHYHKVGKILHFPHGRDTDQVPEDKLAEYLHEVANDLEEALKSTILGGFIRETYEFDCTACGDKVVCNKKQAEKHRRAVCLNPNCGAEHFVEISSEGAIFRIKASGFECLNCRKTTFIENRKLDIGRVFQCSACDTEHQFVTRQWGYGIIKREPEKIAKAHLDA